VEFDPEIERRIANIHENVLKKFKKQSFPEEHSELNNEIINTNKVMNQTILFDDLLLGDPKSYE
jgi:hypothetical protein